MSINVLRLYVDTDCERCGGLALRQNAAIHPDRLLCRCVRFDVGEECSWCKGSGKVYSEPSMTLQSAHVVPCPRCAQRDASTCPACGSPCPPGLAMCVECQAREGRE